MIIINSIPLQGFGLALRPLSLDDANEMERAVTIDDSRAHWFTSIPEPSECSNYIQKALDMYHQGSRHAWCIRDSHGTFLGTSSFHDIVPEADRVEIGYTWYIPAVRRTFVNTACKIILLEHAFTVLGCGAVGWRTDHENLRSKNAILALGATFDGTIKRNRLRKNGTIGDTLLFSMLREDWPAVKERLHQRLATHGFTASP